MWEDNRSAFWSGKKVSNLNSAKCFFKSLVQKNRIIRSSDFGFEVYTSVFISAFIGRLVGKYKALRWMRNHNKKSLNKLVKQINPDIIFHADGYYFFPALNKNIPEYADLQDDINWSNIPAKNLKDVRQYYTNQFNSSKLNFIVSESAKNSITKYIKSEFIPISNGADFDAITNISQQTKNAFKKQNNIPINKKIVSYIGGAHKFDKAFTKQLIKKAEKDLPNTVFVLAGNLPVIESPNAIFTGIISNDEANILYSISDIGLTLKNTLGNDFIYNSVPLKFIQYAAAKKPVISFPIKWSVDNAFPTIIHINNENANNWIVEIKKVSSNFKWKEDYNLVWEQYDWKNIAATIYNKIEIAL